MGFHPDSLPDLTGRVYVVTGATSGIGFHTAAHLASHGAKVYACARTPAKGETMISSIRELYPNAVRLNVLVMDQANLGSVVSAAKHILEQETELHALVNNAGVMATPFAITADGYEEQWQVNYLAHWVLTRWLTPLMLRTTQKPGHKPGTVRIVNLSSSGHFWAPKTGINFQDPSLSNDTAMSRYGQSKLANALHAKTIHQQQQQRKDADRAVWTAIVHPSLVISNLTRRSELPIYLRAIQNFAETVPGIGRDPNSGSWTSLFCAASDQMTAGQSGTYFQPVARSPGWESGHAKDANLAQRLEEWTVEEMKKGGWIEE